LRGFRFFSRESRHEFEVFDILVKFSSGVGDDRIGIPFYSRGKKEYVSVQEVVEGEGVVAHVRKKCNE
jgi:hypothetical protein